MSLLLQQSLVGIAVLAGALFSFWRLASHRARLATLAKLENVPGLRGRRFVAALRGRILAQQVGACGACAQGATPSAASRNRTPGALRR
jgi:hypothetical protein